MTGGKIVTKEVFVSRVEEMIPVLYRVCRAHFSLPQDPGGRGAGGACTRLGKARHLVRRALYADMAHTDPAQRMQRHSPQTSPCREGGVAAATACARRRRGCPPGGTDGAPAPASPAGGALLYGRNDAAGVRKGAGLARKPGEKPAACRACALRKLLEGEEEAE